MESVKGLSPVAGLVYCCFSVVRRCCLAFIWRWSCSPLIVTRTEQLLLSSWRILINLGWLAALVVLYIAINPPPELIGFNGVAASLHSLLVLLFAVAAIAVAVLTPYWGLVGKFTS